MNLYAYVGDDPIDGQDANGHVSYLSGDGSWDGLDGFAKHEMDKAMSKPASNSGISPAQKCVGWLCWLRNVFTVNGGSSVSPSGQFSALMMAGGAAGYIEASTYMRQHPAVTRAATGAANLAFLVGTDGLGGELEAGVEAAESIEGAASEIQFGNNPNQDYHTFRHIEEAGLDKKAVRQAIEKDLSGVKDSLPNGLKKGTVTVGGKTVDYHAFKLSSGVINVGRITVR